MQHVPVKDLTARQPAG